MNKREEIFDKLLKENRKSIYRICLAYLYDRSHADDLYQEILIQIWKSLDSFRGDAQLSTWIYRIAVNTAISYNTRQNKAKHDVLHEQLTLADDEHEHQLNQNERIKQLYHAISQLKEQDRLIISLVLEGLSYKEISEVTGLSVSNTGVRVNRAKEKLTRFFNTQTGNDGL